MGNLAILANKLTPNEILIIVLKVIEVNPISKTIENVTIFVKKN